MDQAIQEPMSAPSDILLPPPANRGGLFGDYTSRYAVFDEMDEPSGALRPHWQMFVNLLNDLGPEELERRWQTSRQLIHDNGVTYNVYGDPAGMDPMEPRRNSTGDCRGGMGAG